MKAKKIITAISLLLLAASSQAQDLHFSQFYENASLRNPALTGIYSGDYKIGLNYRRQWGSISVPFQTALLTAETKFKVNEVNDFFSCGISLLYDKAGSAGLNSYYILPALCYNKSLEDEHRSYLSVGVIPGYVFRTVNSSQMIFGDQFVNGYYSPDNLTADNVSNNRVRYFDLAAGVSFNSSLGERKQINYYLGAAAFHINQPKIAFQTDDAYMSMNRKWCGNAGMQWIVNEHALLSVHGNYTRQGNNQSLVAGFLAAWKTIDPNTRRKFFALYGGVFFRFGDAWIPTLKMDYKTYSFNFSYDVNTSGLVKGSEGRGGFEISVYTKGFSDKGIFATDKTKCPRFEDMLEPEY